MLTHYITLKSDGEHEIEIKKSRFICQLARVDNEAAAQAFIAACKKSTTKPIIIVVPTLLVSRMNINTHTMMANPPEPPVYQC